MVAVVVGLVFVIYTTMHGMLSGHTGPADMSEEAVAARIAPVGQLNTGAAIMPVVAAEPAPAKARTGEEVFNTVCFACHKTGAAGAPMFGDKAAWAPRIKQGLDTLHKHAMTGIRAMPPRGTCSNCSDDELKGAVDYMVSHSK